MNPSPNRLLWRFYDATTPAQWVSKQAERIYKAALSAETAGAWINHAVGGSVRGISNKTEIPRLTEPQFGSNASDAAINSQMRAHISAVRRHADKMEAELAAYGPGSFRKRTAQIAAPRHPFNAEAALLAVINGGYDEITVHGVRFVKDRSGAFVASGETEQR